jgi:hypothetical protein
MTAVQLYDAVFDPANIVTMFPLSYKVTCLASSYTFDQTHSYSTVITSTSAVTSGSATITQTSFVPSTLPFQFGLNSFTFYTFTLASTDVRYLFWHANNGTAEYPMALLDLGTTYSPFGVPMVIGYHSGDSWTYEVATP